MVWYGLVWYSMVWSGIVWSGVSCTLFGAQGYGQGRSIRASTDLLYLVCFVHFHSKPLPYS